MAAVSLPHSATGALIFDVHELRNGIYVLIIDGDELICAVYEFILHVYVLMDGVYELIFVVYELIFYVYEFIFADYEFIFCVYECGNVVPECEFGTVSRNFRVAQDLPYSRHSPLMS